MINATNTTQATYQKNGSAMGTGSGAGSTGSGDSQKKGMRRKSILAILGLALFVVVAAVGVLIVQRQRVAEGPQAPTAPSSRPSAKVAPGDGVCTYQFDVEPEETPTPPPETPTPPPQGGPLSCEKSAHSDIGTPLTFTNLDEERTVFNPGEIVTFAVQVRNQSPTTDIPITFYDPLNGEDMSQYVTFIDSNCQNESYDPQTRILTCEEVIPHEPTFAPVYILFRVQLSDNIPADVTLVNEAAVFASVYDAAVDGNGIPLCAEGSPLCDTCSVQITIRRGTGGPSPSPSETPRVTPPISPSPTPPESPTPPPVYSCNASCDNDAQCQTVDPDHFCDPATNRCRLETNPTDQGCQPATIYSCNVTCTTDAQCQEANAGYYCDPDLSKCRLASNPDSTSCQPKPNEYSCNSTCTTTAQCQTANSAYVCDTGSGRCRLGSNPGATNCMPPGNPQPTPAPGCQDLCSTNADCADGAHICYTTEDGTNRCRLAEYPNSTTCTVPPEEGVIPTTKGGQPVAQPELPDELPETGGADTLFTWLRAGLVTVAIGVALLLLL